MDKISFSVSLFLWPAKGALTLGQIFGFEDFQVEMSHSQRDPGGAQEVALDVFLVFRNLLLLQLQDNRQEKNTIKLPKSPKTSSKTPKSRTLSQNRGISKL